ncbi:hypothetical protein LTR70_002204 [Exophiala xenobiotica]|uniref:Uncharacterized protein n=1 Tax=Lithohypha guttulata TaxID=1690604 RepID=A0ABR0KHX2_9EURO|nr:hypothetical protein LTR24_002434 [Lithohypha guttulata]KAK5326204.1 hypothetical protein LTR70_002204 [Exophiala xenobiotica]
MYGLVLLVHLFCLGAAQSTADPQNATVFSLTYGYPLLAWQKFYVPILEARGANTWTHARELSTPASRTVVKPNVDTIYSTLVYDLSQSDLEITLPDVPAENFKLFSLYDPFGDNWANVGTGGFFEPGKYLIRPSGTDDGSDVGLQVINESNVAYLTSPTHYGTVLIRWGLNATNLDLVHQLQDDCSSNVVARNVVSDVSIPRLETLVDAFDATSSPAENVMNLLAQFGPRTAPAASLEAAGISNATYSPPPSVNLTVANATTLTMIVEEALDSDNLDELNNGWVALSPELIGIYGTNYALRALIAATGYLALRNPFAVYPNFANGTGGLANAALTLGPNEAVLFTFSGKPPLQDVGFWSLTAYDADNFLIPNDIEVYALGDRSNVTYLDGSRVYDNATGGNRDGVFQILLQPADVAPPANWTSNWLPAPAGGGGVVAQLRLFAGQQAAIDGSYMYPVVTRISALTGGNGTSNGGGSPTLSSPSGSGISTYTGKAASSAPVGTITLTTVYMILMASTLLY